MFYNHTRKVSFLRICLVGFLCAFITFNALAGPGAVDTTFNVGPNGPIYCTLVQPNGKILIGGAFSAINGTSRNMFARLNPSGSIDTSITNVLGFGTTYCMLVQTDGKFVLGGNFSISSGQFYHYNIIRLNPDGSIDNTFTNSSPNSSVYAMAQQTDGKILIGGQFTFLANSNHYYIARLNSDGTVDSTFNPGTINGSMVNAIAIQNDGNILIGGNFSSFITYGLTRNYIARLTATGIPDLTYTTSANGPVQAIYIEDSGKAVYVGNFSTINNTSRNHAARVNMDGSLDNTFTTSFGGANNTVYTVTEDENDDIYQGGQFATYNNTQVISLARTFSDGTLDSTFNTNSSFFSTQTVRAVAIQPDGKVIVGGQFNFWGTLARTNLVRLYGNNYPAEITTQPKSTNILVGSNVTFSVDVSNPTPLSYQWYYNGTAIQDATDNEYSIFNAQVYDSGTYSVLVSAGMGAITSSNAILHVGIPPAITQLPTNFTAIAGQNATNFAAASGTPLNFYWYNNFRTLVGTNATLVLTNVTTVQQGLYTFVASNFFGAVSNSAILTVLSPISIISQPQNESVGVGGTASFSVLASGSSRSYQWLKDGTPIVGANGSIFSITNVAFTDAAGYSVIVSNQFNSLTSSVATLTVGYPPMITMQPTNVTANLGDTVSFASAASGTGPLTYQWLLNSNAITGQIATNLVLTNVQINTIGYYALSVTSPFGSTVSSNVALNLNGYPFNLYNGLIAYYPFDGNANDVTGNGNNGTVYGATLTQDRFGNAGMAYQFDGVSNFISATVSNLPVGAAPRTLSLWTKSDVTNSTSEVDAAGWGTSAFLQQFAIVNYDAPSTNGTNYAWIGACGGAADDSLSGVIVDTNWHHIVISYDGLNFMIAVDGTNGNNIGVALNTAVSSLFIGAASSGAYFPGAVDDVRVYNRAFSPTDMQQLYQFESGMPSIQQQPQSLALTSGQTANFSVQASGTGTLAYQWYWSNAPIALATNAVLTIPSVHPGIAGPYYVVVSNAMGSVTSIVANISVGAPPQSLNMQVASHMPVIQMQGTPGFNYVVQCATNLMPPVMWQNVATIPADTNGNWSFTDTNPPTNGARFYRVVAP